MARVPAIPVVVGEKERKRERLTIIIYTATSFRFGRLGKEVLRHHAERSRSQDVAAYKLTSTLNSERLYQTHSGKQSIFVIGRLQFGWNRAVLTSDLRP